MDDGTNPRQAGSINPTLSPFPHCVGVRGNSIRADHQVKFHTRRVVAQLCPGHRSYSSFTPDAIPTPPHLQLSHFSHITPASPHPRVPLIFVSPRIRDDSTAFLIMYTVGNIYVITAVAVIGGGLFGFDISSMSAIISTQPYLCYFK